MQAFSAGWTVLSTSYFRGMEVGGHQLLIYPDRNWVMCRMGRLA